jgi:hypothetical protein
MKTTKNKTCVIVLFLTLMLALSACGGGSAAPDDTVPGNGESGTTQNDSDDANAPDTNNPAAPNVPDNGTPVNAPSPFENHAGDKGYFYSLGDDYIVFMDDFSGSMGIDTSVYGNGTRFTVVFFGGDANLYGVRKWVFESGAYAKKFVDDSRDILIAIENVVYMEEHGTWQPGPKEDYLNDSSAIYASKP